MAYWAASCSHEAHDRFILPCWREILRLATFPFSSGRRQSFAYLRFDNTSAFYTPHHVPLTPILSLRLLIDDLSTYPLVFPNYFSQLITPRGPLPTEKSQSQTYLGNLSTSTCAPHPLRFVYCDNIGPLTSDLICLLIYGWNLSCPNRRTLLGIYYGLEAMLLDLSAPILGDIDIRDAVPGAQGAAIAAAGWFKMTASSVPKTVVWSDGDFKLFLVTLRSLVH